jgi:hypothetical protein
MNDKQCGDGTPFVQVSSTLTTAFNFTNWEADHVMAMKWLFLQYEFEFEAIT